MAVSYDQLKDGELLRPPADLSEPALTVNGTKVLERRYLHRIDNRVVETPGGGFWRVAEEVARGGASWIDQAGLEARTREYYRAMASLEFLPNSPTLMNAGKRNGLQYSACYVLPVEDSMDGIFESVKRAALIHKSGGGCIAGDARVWTTFCGIEPIEVLVNRATADGRGSVRHGAGMAYDVRDLGIQTLSMNPFTGETGLRQVTHVWRFDVPAEKQVAVSMREGVVVQTSDWHPFMVLRGTELVEVPAGALVPGDVVLGPDRPDSYWPWSETRTVGSLAIDPELAWLIGFTLGDGSFGYVPALRQYRVRWFSGASDVLERVRTVLARAGIQVSIERDARGVLSVSTLTQRFVHDLLEACGLEKIGPKDDLIRIPEIIAKSPLSVVRAFVAGLLDSDGYVDLDGSPSYTTASEAMAEDLAALMGLLGYQPTVRAKAPHGKGRRTTYTVQLCSLPQVDELAGDIGPYLNNAQRRERLHSTSRKQTALRLSFHLWRDRLATLGVVKARGDEVGGPGPCAAELNRWSCNVGGRVRRDDLRAIAAQVTPRDPGLGRLLTRLAANGQEVARVERAAVAKPYYDLTVEGWNTYAAGRSGLAMVHNTGFAFSRLRPSGDIVGSTGGVASGPVSFMEVFNGATESVKQGGTRRGANMGILRIDHPDVLQFIDCKRVLRDGPRAAYEAVAGQLAPAARDALRKSLLETQISNFNISLAVTDRFMEALAADGEYELIHPRSGDVVKRLRARDVFDRMVQAAWETGDPGVVFIDRINAGPANPVPEMGPVEATNPCGEQPLYPNEACNLGSINLARFVRPGGVQVYRHGRGVAGVEAIDWERLERTVRTAIRFLDDVITVNPYPDTHIDRAVKANRRVGLGVMGWADLLIDLEIPYDSEEALRLGTEVMRRLNEWAHDESCRLAEERGPFPNWPKSIYKDGRPQRNATVTTIAPTGTISIIAGCSSGIEPLFALVFDRKGSLDGQLSLEVYERFTEVAKREGFWTEDLARQVHQHGTVRGLDSVPEKWQRVFGTAHDIHPDWHVRMQGAFQQHTDNAVSKTINLPHDAVPTDVERAYTLAYEAGCNGITVYRDGSKLGVLHAGSGGGTEAAAADGRTMLERPKAMDGVTYSVETPLGTAYITVNHDAEQEPREVFVNQGKAGSDIAPLSEAIGKLASIVLRVPSPMPPRERLAEITRRLRGIGGSTSLGFGPERTRSLPDALAKVLEEYLDRPRPASQAAPTQPAPAPQAPATSGATMLPIVGAALNGNGHANGHARLRGPRITGDLCPDCGTALVYEEGCSKCMGCGYARC
ncbi:MAG TPA: adenosylcobalamin-dependent ribonucleoside-diphosphate reductase [Chloroflexota bacterium]|nr:adenosylcobalamin-dependent ribonucleoside-diphosphate reductase [Chloroflexota bacterium]